ncbi:MAG: hypothetical protein ACE5IF_06540 [Candidatus Bathyarchaeia archaeon]
MTRGKKRSTRRRRSGGQRTVDQAVQILWKVVDEAKMYLEDPMLTPEEKRRWAKTLADTIGVLNKLLANQGERPLEDEDLGSLLTKVPRTFRRTVKRRVGMWRRRRSF